MDSQQLQLRLKEIETYIGDFKKELAESEDRYQESLKLTTTREASSLLMEQHVVQNERQREALARMESLYDQVQNQLGELNKFN